MEEPSVAETEIVIVEYATLEEVTTEVSTDPGLVDRLTGEVPVKSIPLTEEPETETVADPSSISMQLTKIEKEDG